MFFEKRTKKLCWLYYKGTTSGFGSSCLVTFSFLFLQVLELCLADNEEAPTLWGRAQKAYRAAATEFCRFQNLCSSIIRGKANSQQNQQGNQSFFLHGAIFENFSISFFVGVLQSHFHLFFLSKSAHLCFDRMQSPLFDP